MDNNERQPVLMATDKAVMKFGRVEFEALARRVIHFMQRVSASGILVITIIKRCEMNTVMSANTVRTIH